MEEGCLYWKELNSRNIYQYDGIKTTNISQNQQTDRSLLSVYNDQATWATDDGDIIYFDGELATTIIEAKNDLNLSPQIYQNKIVWYKQNDMGQQDIYMYDILTGNIKNITNTGNTPIGSPQISKNKISWFDGGIDALRLLDMNTGEISSTSSINPSNYKIGNDFLVGYRKDGLW